MSAATLVHKIVLGALVGGVTMGLSACGAGSNEQSDRALRVLTPPSSSTALTTAAPPPAPSCGDPRSSYPALEPLPPAATLASDPAIGAILARGKLVVAVDENTEGLAARDSDGQLVGLEIDLARAIAQSIFGLEASDRLELLTVTTKQKIDLPAHGDVDMSISAISMTCERWSKVAFSAEYFTAEHAFLVRGDSSANSVADFAGRRVCMTKGSTSIDTLARLGLEPASRPWLVDARTDCLVALQEGKVDAYFGHDTFLVGMVAQDPGLRIVPQGERQHYGIAMGPRNVALVRYVNGVLNGMRDDGTLAGLYARWLGPLYRDSLRPLPEVPEPDSTRPTPLPVSS